VLKHRYFVVLIVGLALAGLFGWPRAGWAVLKLYLKDGSYQLVKSYEVQGDRVRYYSVERSAWEEIPVSMVDFDATKRVEDEEKALQEKQLNQAHELDNQRFELDKPTGFEIAPGFHLPGGDGVFAFDGKRVIPLAQSSADIIRDKKRFALSLALPGPLLKSRDLVVLDGARAAVRILALQPNFYVQFADSDASKIQLIPVVSKKEYRVIEKIQSGIGVGKSGEVRDAVAVEREEIKPGLFMIRPAHRLAIGEYALAELLSEKLNLEVWDFGIDGAPGGQESGDAPPVIRRHDTPPEQ
jgi:hypothetical protein